MSVDEEERDEAPGRRCSICALDWPISDDYEVCPSCLEPTDKVSNIVPMDKAEAVSLKAQFDFERFYDEWDQTHPPERLDTIGMKDYDQE